MAISRRDGNKFGSSSITVELLTPLFMATGRRSQTSSADLIIRLVSFFTDHSLALLQNYAELELAHDETFWEVLT